MVNPGALVVRQVDDAHRARLLPKGGTSLELLDETVGYLRIMQGHFLTFDPERVGLSEGEGLSLTASAIL